MPALTLDDADELLTITLPGREPVALDLFVAHDAFAAELDGWRKADDAAAGGSAAAMLDYYERLKAAAAVLGFGAVSGTTAEKIRRAVASSMDAAAKKVPAGSPAPTS